ncbi:MAG: YihY/virulence factor BrkB family protein, partial [Chloroflexota bacterium]
ISGIIRNRAPVTGIALGILLWSGSNIFNQLTRALDGMWGVPRKRSFLRRRGFAMLMALSLSFVLLIVFIAEGTIGAIVNSFIPDDLQQYRPYTVQLWAGFVSIGLFGVMYYLLPHVPFTWRQIAPGAVLGGLAWELGKRGFLIFINLYLTRSNLVYGSVSIIIIFLIWVYVTTMIFMFGAYLNYEYTKQKESEQADNFTEIGAEQPF